MKLNQRSRALLRGARPTKTGALATLPDDPAPAPSPAIDALRSRRLGHLVQVWFRPDDLATLDRLRGCLSRSAFVRLRSLA